MHQFVPVKEHIWEGEGGKLKYQVASSIDGRLQGGGDPRVACRGQAGERMRQQDDVWKSESEMWRLQKNLEGREKNLAQPLTMPPKHRPSHDKHGATLGQGSKDQPTKWEGTNRGTPES